MSIFEVIATALIVLSTWLIVATVISVWRAPDALTRVNLLGPIVGLAVPLLTVAKFIADTGVHGFDPGALIKVILVCFGVWIVASVGSFYMGRAVYGVTVTDVKHARRREEQESAANDKAAEKAQEKGAEQ